MVIVRLLLFLSLATIAGSLLLYFFTRNRRYLQFIWQVVKFTLLVLVAVLLFFAAERLLAPMLGPLLLAKHPCRLTRSGSAAAQQATQRGLQRPGRQRRRQSFQGPRIPAIPLTRNAFLSIPRAWTAVAREAGFG